MKKLIRFGLLVRAEINFELSKAILNTGELVFRDLVQAQVIISDSVERLAEAEKVYSQQRPVLVLIGDGSVASAKGWQHIPPSHQTSSEFIGDLQTIVATCLT